MAYTNLLHDFPALAAELHPTLNGELSPQDIKPRSAKKIWWLCPKGHAYKTSPVIRTNGSNCPYCAHRLPIVGETDLASCYPDIAKEWHPTKNGNLLPTDVLAVSHKKVWWLCPKGHTYNQKIEFRTTAQRSGCPYCAGRKALKGFNDLASVYPELITEWNYDKNDILPSELTAGSHTSVWWKCQYGHEWQRSPHQRIHNHQIQPCPECSSIGTSFPEQAILFYLQRDSNMKVEGQYKIHNEHAKYKYYEVDIFIHDINTIIEYNGQRWHTDTKTEKDIDRANALMAQGYSMYYILEPKCQPISNAVNIFRTGMSNNALNESIQQLESLLGISPKGLIDVRQDCLTILHRYHSSTALIFAYPEIAAFWNYEKNDADVSCVQLSTQISFWWKCPLGHEWKSHAQILNRHLNQGENVCPYCDDREFMRGVNDFQTRCPELAEEWDTRKNRKAPSEVFCRSKLSIWWTDKNGHSWQERVRDRYDSYIKRRKKDTNA